MLNSGIVVDRNSLHVDEVEESDEVCNPERCLGRARTVKQHARQKVRPASRPCTFASPHLLFEEQVSIELEIKQVIT